MKIVGKKTGEHLAAGQSEDKRAEAELIRLCIAGERSAQERFYRTYCRPVAANLYRVLGDRNDLDDLVQEVFVIAFRGLPKFRQEARLSTWLYRICVNVALGRIRTKTRRPPPILKADPVEGDVRVSPESPQTLLEREESKARVYRLLEQISPKKRLVLYLHEIEGRDLKDIACLVGANPVTVRTRLFYGRKEFYKLLAEDDS
ncbi:MAG: sigma-70 family RNA polymerase sigma factor [Myxococcales bacterium]|nr:sigma-70 family RNA polymerase sigma factor [Myxococcales bacterium]